MTSDVISHSRQVRPNSSDTAADFVFVCLFLKSFSKLLIIIN